MNFLFLPFQKGKQILIGPAAGIHQSVLLFSRRMLFDHWSAKWVEKIP